MTGSVTCHFSIGGQGQLKMAGPIRGQGQLGTGSVRGQGQLEDRVS